MQHWCRWGGCGARAWPSARKALRRASSDVRGFERAAAWRRGRAVTTPLRSWRRRGVSWARRSGSGNCIHKWEIAKEEADAMLDDE